MTALLLNPIEQAWIQPATSASTKASRRRIDRLRVSVWPWVMLIAAGQGLGALWPHRYNHTPFEDEGLYVYEGHRMIAHLLHRSFVTEYPGSYFSGAPGFYPVLAAVGDYFGGINGARFVSLIFAVVAMVGVCGVGSQLFGKVAGVIGAAAFSLNGSVIYLSHWATYDSCMMAFIALAAWLGVWSAKNNALLWLPAVATLLMLAFMAKYAGAVYFPIVALLAAVVGWPKYRWVALRQAALLLVVSAALTFAVLCVIGRSMFAGIEETTVTRHILSYGSTSVMLNLVYQWIGPWLVVAALGAVFLIATRPHDLPVIAVLAVGSAAGIVDQIHIHEMTSFSKHVAFGLIFAAPLIGGLFSYLLTKQHHFRRRMVGLAAGVTSKVLGLIVVLIVGGYFFQPSGWTNSKSFLTSWAQDDTLVPVLSSYYKEFPNKHILGDAPSPERYEMEKQVKVGLWNDTYVLYYKQLVGLPAYRLAITQDHFGIIYLTDSTPISRYVQSLLDSHTGSYVLRTKLPRYLRGRRVGYWLIYTLASPTTNG